MKHFLVPILTFAVFVLIPAVPISAHTSGASLEAESGEYLIDIGYEPGDMYVGGRMVLDIELNDLDRKLTDFSRVWLRVARDKETLLATGVGKADLGPTTFMIRIPQEWEGDIMLHVRYEREGDGIATASFPLTVAPPLESDALPPWLIPAIAGVLAGAGAGWFVRPRWRRSTQAGGA